MSERSDDSSGSEGSLRRRDFLAMSAVGGALAAATAAGCTVTVSQDVDEAEGMDFALEETTVAELQLLMESGQLSAREVVESYLGRIEAVDGELRSVLENNPDALAIADELDAERAAGNVRGPLHGIPVAIKDNIDTHDRMTTTAGSLALGVPYSAPS